MGQIIDGKAVSAKVKEEIRLETEKLKEQGIEIGLAVVIVGDDPASQVYVRNKEKACETVGFNSFKYALPAETGDQLRSHSPVFTSRDFLRSPVSWRTGLCVCWER